MWQPGESPRNVDGKGGESSENKRSAATKDRDKWRGDGTGFKYGDLPVVEGGEQRRKTRKKKKSIPKKRGGGRKEGKEKRCRTREKKTMRELLQFTGNQKRQKEPRIRKELPKYRELGLWRGKSLGKYYCQEGGGQEFQKKAAAPPEL